MDRRKASKERHEWSYRMGRFMKFDLDTQEVINGDIGVRKILESMSWTLTKWGEMNKIPAEMLPAARVVNFPVPYSVWAGELDGLFDPITRKIFRFLARKLRFRFNFLWATLQAVSDTSNAKVLGDGGAGGAVGGPPDSQNVIQPLFHELMFSGYSAEGINKDSPLSGIPTSLQWEWLGDGNPFADLPEHGTDANPIGARVVPYGD